MRKIINKIEKVFFPCTAKIEAIVRRNAEACDEVICELEKKRQNIVRENNANHIRPRKTHGFI